VARLGEAAFDPKRTFEPQKKCPPSRSVFFACLSFPNGQSHCFFGFLGDICQGGSLLGVLFELMFRKWESIVVLTMRLRDEPFHCALIRIRTQRVSSVDGRGLLVCAQNGPANAKNHNWLYCLAGASFWLRCRPQDHSE